MNVTKKKKPECILVVDDSTDNLYLMQFILESQGYKVGLADNGREALQKISRCHPDLILLDIMMPNMNGYEVIQHLQEDENLPFIPIYLLTADAYVSYSDAVASGANGLIHKPIDINELLLEVQRVLDINSDLSPDN